MKQIRGWEKPLKLKKGDAAIARKRGGCLPVMMKAHCGASHYSVSALHLLRTRVL